MIKKEDILDKTNMGLDIIRHLYPDAGRVIDSGNMKEAFKMHDERTPSAHLKGYPSCWVVTDFGGDQRGHHPISLWMKEKGLGYAESLLDINRELNLGLGNIIIVDRWLFEFNEKITNKELEYLVPASTRMGVDALHWHSVKMIAHRWSDGKYSIRYSTESYPIFMRECRYIEGDEEKKFYKKYEPMCFNKMYSKSYIGDRPRDYINGLYELKEFYWVWNEGIRKLGYKPFKFTKIKSVFICQDELFALWLRSLGYITLWMDSQTEEFNALKFERAKQYAKRFYLLPDWIEMTPEAYIQLEGIKPVLSDSEEGD